MHRALRGVFFLLLTLVIFFAFSTHFYGGRRLLVAHNRRQSSTAAYNPLRDKLGNFFGSLSALLISQGLFGSSGQPRTKTVLLWTPFFGDVRWLPPLAKLGCPMDDCLVVENKSRLYDSDAVIFHWRDVDVKKLPAKHPPGQVWILFNEESPEHSPSRVLEALGDGVNWTMTYRRDSDIFAPYGRLRKKTLAEKLVDSGKMTWKSCCSGDESNRNQSKELAAWLVSNCNTPGGRERFVKELQRHVPVAVFGKCGDLKCPTQNRVECYEHLGSRYKFYLSFENSICKDYVTEKLFYAMAAGMVPVVFGGADYSSILPPNSFVDALGFDSPKQLADHLRTLDEDEALYMSYHAWRDHFVVEDFSFRWICDVCTKLDATPSAPYIHSNLATWWFDNASCRSWTDDDTDTEE